MASLSKVLFEIPNRRDSRPVLRSEGCPENVVAGPVLNQMDLMYNPHILFHEDPFQYYHQSTLGSLPFCFSGQHFVSIYHLFCACNMAHQSHFPLCHQPNDIWRRAQLSSSS
jgi:hypothetical protein